MANSTEKTRDQGKTWNFWATMFFILCVIGLGFGLQLKGIATEDITFGNITLMVLATYRLTRILVFDKIFKLFRDFFRNHQRLYVFFVIKEIITCPWCAGVWVALTIIATYFLVPFGELFTSGIVNTKYPFRVIDIPNPSISQHFKSARACFAAREFNFVIP